jgi:hypothetical protein
VTKQVVGLQEKSGISLMARRVKSHVSKGKVSADLYPMATERTL